MPKYSYSAHFFKLSSVLRIKKKLEVLRWTGVARTPGVPWSPMMRSCPTVTTRRTTSWTPAPRRRRWRSRRELRNPLQTPDPAVSHRPQRVQQFSLFKSHFNPSPLVFRDAMEGQSQRPTVSPPARVWDKGLPVYEEEQILCKSFHQPAFPWADPHPAAVGPDRN